MTSSRSPHPATRHPLVLAALGVVGFSLTLPMTKIVVHGMDPVTAAGLRAVVASCLAGVALRIGRRPWPTRAQRRQLLLVAGGIVIGFPVCTAFAVRWVPASHGAVVISLLPLATAGLAVLRVGERPSARYWACSGAGLAAVLLYALDDGGGSLHLADLLLVVAVLTACVGYVEGSLLSHQMPGWAVVSWALVLSAPVTVALTVASLATSDGIDLTTGQLLAFLYTAAISMFAAFFPWYAALRAGIARAGQLQLLQPVLTIAWSWPLLSEDPTIATALTAAAVLLAVAVGRRATISVANAVADDTDGGS